MSYEAGFAAGERDAFHDRRAGQVREQTAPASTAEERGYWAGYVPRSATWGALQRTPVEEPAQEWAD